MDLKDILVFLDEGLASEGRLEFDIGWHGAPHSHAAEVRRSMQLRYVQAGVNYDLRYRRRRFIHEYSHLPHSGRDLLRDQRHAIGQQQQEQQL